MVGITTMSLNTGNVARETKEAKDYLKGKVLNYSDDFYHLKGKRRYSSDCFPFTEYAALNEVKDCKTNNYSQMFLTKRAKNDEVLGLDELAEDASGTASTSVVTIARGNMFLYWADAYTETGSAPNMIEARVKQYDGDYSERYLFNLEYVDNGICKISRDYSGEVYYLSVKDTSEWDLYTPEWHEAQRDNMERWSKQYFHTLVRWSTIPSDQNRWIVDVVDGETIFSIELPDENGNKRRYYLHITEKMTLDVSEDASAADGFILPQK